MSILKSKSYLEYNLNDYVSWFKMFNINGSGLRELYVTIDSRYYLGFYNTIQEESLLNNRFTIIIQDYYDLINDNNFSIGQKNIINHILAKKIMSLIQTFKKYFYLNPILRIDVKSDIERYLKSLGDVDEI